MEFAREIIEYDDCILVVSNHIFAKISYNPAASFATPLSETVYSGYSKEGELLWRKAIHDCCNEDLQDEDTEGSENFEPNANGVRIFDPYHPDDSERYPFFSVTLPALDNATVECRDENFNPVYLNGEKLPLNGFGVPSFYLSDLTGDGYPELCFGISYGSGITDQRIEIIDYTTKTVIFSLSDRMDHDYYLFLRNGVLCVKEKKCLQSNVTRTGVLIYDGSEIAVLWDSEVNDTFDRDIQSDTVH